MTDDSRISKLREYLFQVINKLTPNKDYQININMLSNKIDDYSLDKIPTENEVETWITGLIIHKDVYSFRSRKSYSQKAMDNIKKMGFFEQFEYAIQENNEKGILPDINGIESIECLNAFTMVSNDDGNSATFDIQIQITYRDSEEGGKVSL